MRCTVCLHGERAAIDRALVAGGAGATERTIAARYGLSKAAVHRHRAHIGPSLVPPPSDAPVASTTASPEPHDLLAFLRKIVDDARRIAESAEGAEDYRAACAALREQSRVIEILMRGAEARAEAERAMAARAPMTDEELEELVREASAELERRREAQAA